MPGVAVSILGRSEQSPSSFWGTWAGTVSNCACLLRSTSLDSCFCRIRGLDTSTARKDRSSDFRIIYVYAQHNGNLMPVFQDIPDESMWKVLRLANKDHNYLLYCKWITDRHPISLLASPHDPFNPPQAHELVDLLLPYWNILLRRRRLFGTAQLFWG